MWSKVVAWAVSKNGVPTIAEPWPVKDVGFLKLE